MSDMVYGLIFGDRFATTNYKLIVLKGFTIIKTNGRYTRTTGKKITVNPVVNSHKNEATRYGYIFT